MSVAGAIKGAKIGGGIGSKLSFIPGVGPVAGLFGAAAGAAVGALQKDKVKAGLLGALKGETGPSKEATDVAEAASRANIGNQALSANILAQGPQAGRSGGRSFAPQGQAAAENRARVQDTIKEAAAATGVETGKAMIASGDRKLAINQALIEHQAAKKAETDEQLFGKVNPKTGQRMDSGFVGQLGGVLDKVGGEIEIGNNPFTGRMKKVAEEVTGGGAPAEAAASGLFKIPGNTGDEYQRGADGSWSTRKTGSTGGWNPLAGNTVAIAKLEKEAVQAAGAPAAGAPTGSAEEVAAARVEEKKEDQTAIEAVAGEGEEDGERMLVNDMGETSAEQEAGAAYRQERKELADLTTQMSEDFGRLPPEAQAKLGKLINPTVWKEYSEANKQAVMRIIPSLFEDEASVFEGETERAGQPGYWSQ